MSWDVGLFGLFVFERENSRGDKVRNATVSKIHQDVDLNKSMKLGGF